MRNKKISYWTDDEIQILKRDYGTVKVSELAKMLKRTEGAIIMKANRLGIYSKVENGLLYQNPWNKGVKMGACKDIRTRTIRSAMTKEKKSFVDLVVEGRV